MFASKSCIEIVYNINRTYALKKVLGIFLIFLDFLDFYMGFWAREGLEMVRGWIRIHLDQVSAQMDHSGSIWGSIFDFKFFGKPYGAQIAPSWSQARLDSGTF